MSKKNSQVEKLINYIELHDVKAIDKGFKQGVDPNGTYKEKPIFNYLLSMYTRSPRFKECVRAFVDHGLDYEDDLFLAILLDDAKSADLALKENPHRLKQKYTIEAAYTPLLEASLLHVCAEFNHIESAKVLIDHGADINQEAGVDFYGFGGQTPIFHTVNQNQNQSQEMLDFLLAQNADLSITLKGIRWGKGFPWETLVPAVNPISYAMFGLLPQFHRDEITTHQIVKKLMHKAYGIAYELKNVPNDYLKKP